MSNYRRLISYIYAYEGGVKGKNIGFAKIESRGAQCKIGVNVKKIYVGSNDIGVYLLSGEAEIFIGKIFVRNGSGEFRTVVAYHDVEHSGVSMDQCYGLTIHEVDNAWQAYTTIWEDAVAQAAEIELESVTAENRIAKELEKTGEDASVREELKMEAVVREIEEEVARADVPEDAKQDAERTPLADASGEGAEGMPRADVSGESAEGMPRVDVLGESVERMPRAEAPGESAERMPRVDASGESVEKVSRDEIHQPENQWRRDNDFGYISYGGETNAWKTAVEQSVVGIKNGADGLRSSMKPYEEKKAQNADLSAAEEVDGETTGVKAVGRGENADKVAPATPLPAGAEGELMSAASAGGREREYSETSGFSAQHQSGPWPALDRTAPRGVPGSNSMAGNNSMTGNNMMTRSSYMSENGCMSGNAGMSENSYMSGNINMSGNAGMPGNADMPGNGSIPESGAIPIESAMTGNRGVTWTGSVTGSSGMMNPGREPVRQDAGNRVPESLHIDQPDRPLVGDPQELERLQREDMLEPEEGSHEQIWEQMKREHAKIPAFDYERGCEILVIKPQDIGLMPRENWVFGNNSFMLHGYYNFRYLILARLNNPGGIPRYLLGVPGHYYNNEKYMASMFGFPNFVLSKQQPVDDGRFGYWYTDVKLGS